MMGFMFFDKADKWLCVFGLDRYNLRIISRILCEFGIHLRYGAWLWPNTYCPICFCHDCFGGNYKNLFRVKILRKLKLLVRFK